MDGDLQSFLPKGNGLDVLEVLVESFLVFPTNFHQLMNVVVVYLDSLVPHVGKLVVLHYQSVGCFFSPRVVDVLEGCLRVQLYQQVLQIIQPVGRSHLI